MSSLSSRVSPATRHFVRHYVEMVVAMFLGMVVLACPPAGRSARPARAMHATPRADVPRDGGDDDRPDGRLDALPRPRLAAERGDVGLDAPADVRRHRPARGRARRGHRRRSWSLEHVAMLASCSARCCCAPPSTRTARTAATRRRAGGGMSVLAPARRLRRGARARLRGRPRSSATAPASDPGAARARMPRPRRCRRWPRPRRGRGARAADRPRPGRQRGAA